MTKLIYSTSSIYKMSLFNDKVISGASFIKNANHYASSESTINGIELMDLIEESRLSVKRLRNGLSSHLDEEAFLLNQISVASKLPDLHSLLGLSWAYHALSFALFKGKKYDDSISIVVQAIMNDRQIYERYPAYSFFYDSHIMLISRLCFLSSLLPDLSLYSECCDFLASAISSTTEKISDKSPFYVPDTINRHVSSRRKKWLISLVSNQLLSSTILSSLCRSVFLKSFIKYFDLSNPYISPLHSSLSNFPNINSRYHKIFDIKEVYPYNFWLLPVFLRLKQLNRDKSSRSSYLQSLNLSSFHNHIIPQNLLVFLETPS